MAQINHIRDLKKCAELYKQVAAAEKEVKNGAKPIPAREAFSALRKKYVK